jgi:hypothetical protein
MTDWRRDYGGAITAEKSIGRSDKRRAIAAESANGLLLTVESGSKLARKEGAEGG